MSKPKKNSGEQSADETQPVNSPRVRAAACPRSKHHKNTRVYRTVGQTRYCVCDDCGHTWKQIGPVAGEPVEVEEAPAA